MISQVWKWPHITKGVLTWLPPLDAWRRTHISTGGTDNARYCYSVWLRHLVTLEGCGFCINGARVAELGPGDSVGTGLAALLTGAGHYTGLDLMPSTRKANLNEIFEELVRLFKNKEAIPGDNEFPRIRPRLRSYEFPEHMIDWQGINDRVERLRADIKDGIQNSHILTYKAPWISISDIPRYSCDLIFSQAVLEYATPLADLYRATYLWLKPGQYASHVFDLSAHYLSPYWNGHWAYYDIEWRLAQGRRETFLNREPLSKHIACAQEFGLRRNAPAFWWAAAERPRNDHRVEQPTRL